MQSVVSASFDEMEPAAWLENVWSGRCSFSPGSAGYIIYASYLLEIILAKQEPRAKYSVWAQLLNNFSVPDQEYFIKKVFASNGCSARHIKYGIAYIK